MQLGKLEAAVDEARRTNEPMPQFLGALGVRMTQEPTRNPEIIRAVLQAYLSSTPVREAMLDLQKRVQGLHTQMIRLGQEQGEIRNDLPAEERSEEHTSELQSRLHLVCRLLLEKKKAAKPTPRISFAPKIFKWRSISISRSS